MSGDEQLQCMIRVIFSASVDRSRPRSLFEAMRRGLIPPQHMAEAKKIMAMMDSRPRKPKTALPARSAYNDPSWDNVVRALEEDR
jgi:hypothetical protein